MRVIFDTKLRLPAHARLVETAAEVPTWVVCSADAPAESEEALVTRGVEVLRAPSSAEEGWTRAPPSGCWRPRGS